MYVAPSVVAVIVFAVKQGISIDVQLMRVTAAVRALNVGSV